MSDFIDSLGGPSQLLKDQLKQARDTALSADEYRAKQEERTKLMAEFMRGQMTEEDYGVARQKLLDQAGIITFNTIMDFKNALSLLPLTRKEVEQITAHENDHFNVAQKHGLKGKYALAFGKSAGHTHIFPSVLINPPRHLDVEQQRKILAEIVNAPENLSLGDQVVLGKK